MAARIVRYLRKRGKVVHRVDTINEKFPPIEVAPPHKSLATINHSPGVGIEVVILAIKPHQKAKGIIMQMLAKGINNLWIQENYHWNETELGQEILQFAVVKGVKVHVGNLMLEGVHQGAENDRSAQMIGVSGAAPGSFATSRSRTYIGSLAQGAKQSSLQTIRSYGQF